MSQNSNYNLYDEVTEDVAEVQPVIKRMLALKIVMAIFCAIATVFVLWTYIDLAISFNNVEGWEGLGLAVVLVVMLPLAIASYAIPFIMSLVGMIMSIVRFRKKVVTRGTMIYFIVFTAVNVLGILFAIFGFRIMI